MAQPRLDDDEDTEGNRMAQPRLDDDEDTEGNKLLR
jgi:hypothetical protein